MDREAVESVILRFIQERFMAPQGLDGAGVEELIFEKGVMDSLGMLELLTFLEGKFQVSFGSEDLTWENLSTIRQIAQTVLRLQKKLLQQGPE